MTDPTPAGELAVPAGSPLYIRPGQSGWTDAQRAALEQLGLDQAPEPDLAVFFHVCARVRLDPFAKQIYMIGRNDRELGRKRWTIQTGIEGFRIVSERRAEFAGVGDTEWCGPDGEWRDVWVDERRPPVAARFTTYRHDQAHPIRGVAHFREYVQLNYDGSPTRMWSEKGAHMVGKVAEALSRRKAFPQDLAGIFTDDEMARADSESREARVTPNGRPVFDMGAGQRPDAPDWAALTAQHEAAGSREELSKLWKMAAAARAGDAVLEAIAAAGERVVAAQGGEPARPAGRLAGEPQRKRMVLLIQEAGVTDDDQRRAVQVAMCGHDIESSKQLTNREAAAIIDQLTEWKTAGRLAHEVTALLPRTPPDGELDPLPNPSRPEEWHTAGHPVRGADGNSYADISDDCTVCAPPAGEPVAPPEQESPSHE